MISERSIQSGISSRVPGEDEWGKAQQRIILYLQSLKIPPFEVLEIALEALKTANEKRESGENKHPVTASLHALRRILLRRNPKGELKPGMKQMMLILPFLDESDLFCAIKSMPPLNRGSMVPDKAKHKLSSHLTSQPALS